jgi:hypothetical protein
MARVRIVGARLGGVLVAVVVSGCVASPPASAPLGPIVTVTAPTATATIPGPVPSTADGGRGDAAAVLAALPVKGRAPKSGYDRAMFGQAWSDDVSVQGGHNGCDTRNDVLRRDLRNVVLKPGSSGCAVLSGSLQDPYSGAAIAFQRGQGTSSLVQIDHIVALGNSWQTGGQRLSSERRRDLANDPLNLWAVSGVANQQKSAGDAATWLPANRSIRCLFVARQVAIKASYGLWVTGPERDAIKQVLERCPGQALPNAKNWSTPAPVGG